MEAHYNWLHCTAEELRRIAESLTKLAETKDRQNELLEALVHNPLEGSPKYADSTAGSPAQPLYNMDKKAAEQGNERKPLSPPREGTVRADIYTVMSDKPMQAKEIIKAVAQRRGIESTDRLAATVREVLRDRYDRRIEKAGYGLYRLASEKPTRS